MLDYLNVMRPDHWLKNIFIVFGHLVAIALLAFPFGGAAPELTVSAHTFVMAALSLVPACFIASANYILNEILDAPFDRLHPTKKDRPVPSGRVRVPVLWVMMGALCLLGFAMALWIFNAGYTIALGLLLLSGVVYNVQPLRLKDRAFLDVIAESFNNPIRLWLGWYALAPAASFPPLSIVMAWWFFGALLMAGKRYAEFRFIGDTERSGRYRKSFRVYTEKSLVLSMVTHANFFCFCMGIAITTYRPNLVFVFPLVVTAILVYLNRAMTEEEARLEPEHLLKSPLVILCTVAVVAISAALAFTDRDLTAPFHFFKLLGG
jgi:decaprenyl-phosphate phosphoribosyltransferase